MRTMGANIHKHTHIQDTQAKVNRAKRRVGLHEKGKGKERKEEMRVTQKVRRKGEQKERYIERTGSPTPPFLFLSSLFITPLSPPFLLLPLIPHFFYQQFLYLRSTSAHIQNKSPNRGSSPLLHTPTTTTTYHRYQELKKHTH